MSSYDDFRFLDVTVDPDGVARVVYGNQLTARGHGELVSIWPRLAADPAVLAVLVTGSDGICTLDPDYLEQMSSGNMTLVMRIMAEMREMIVAAIDFPKPTVAAVNETAVGGVLTFAMMNDIVVAERHVVFADKHIQVGVASGDGTVLMWPLAIGLPKARRFILTGEGIGAEEAERLGLIAEVVDTGASVERGLAYARQLAALPPNAVRFTKRALNEWMRAALPAYDVSWAWEAMTVATANVSEGFEQVGEGFEMLGP